MISMPLIQRIEEAIEHGLALTREDMVLLLSAITTLCAVQIKLENQDMTLYKLRKLLGMVKKSERHISSEADQNGQDDQSDTDLEVSKNTSPKKRNNRTPKNRKTKPIVPTIYHAIVDYHKGQVCPQCQKGKLYKYEPGRLLRVTGHASYEAVQHITDRFRCNACQVVITAPLPKDILEDGAVDQQYGYSARSLMAIHTFYSGLPYYHQGNLANLFGYPICASTFFDQCEALSNAVIPVFYALKRKASSATSFLLDDTKHRILGQAPERRPNRHGKGTQVRTGIYTSGIIALTEEGHDIVLFETSLGHAGEFLDSLLADRPPGLPLPLAMSDALSRSQPTHKDSVKQAFCNAHCRRLFFDLEKLKPKVISWVLETYGMIWETERKAKKEGLDLQNRLMLHQNESLPAMEKLKAWAKNEESLPTFEEHSALGQAIRYLLNHYPKLTLFCREPGALIDNNQMEETLKIPIRGRNTYHFFKTVNGAGIANVLTSLIATTVRAGLNAFNYLTDLQKYQAKVKQNPDDWVPWNYARTLLDLTMELDPMDTASLVKEDST